MKSITEKMTAVIKILEVEVNGEVPESGTITVEKGIVVGYELVYREKIVKKESNKETIISNYLDDLAGNGVVIIGATNETSDSEEITGKITEKYEVTIDGTTHFLYQLDNKALIYDSSIKTGYEQATYVVGNEVTISFVTSDDENVMTVKSITKK